MLRHFRIQHCSTPTYLFAQKEQHRKKTIKKQQQTTKQTGINAALTMIIIISHDMLGLLTGHYRRKCSQRNFSGHIDIVYILFRKKTSSFVFMHAITLKPMTHCPEAGTKNRYQKSRTGFLQVCDAIRYRFFSGTEIWYWLEHCSTPWRKPVRVFWYRFLVPVSGYSVSLALEIYQTI